MSSQQDTNFSIVSNRFSIELDDSHQMPLFDSFSLDDLFRQREKRVNNAIFRRANEQSLESDVELADEIAMWAEIEALQLDRGKDWIRCPDAPRNCYLAGGWYSGDDELWFVNPGVVGDLPLAEVFRGQLITGLIASSLSEAIELFEERWAQIRSILEMQTAAIQDFNNELRSYALDRVQNSRALRRSKAH